jgi:hypothetical protein
MTQAHPSISLPWRLMRFVNRRVMPKTHPKVRLSGLALLPTRFRNLAANPHVEVQVERQALRGLHV